MAAGDLLIDAWVIMVLSIAVLAVIGLGIIVAIFGFSIFCCCAKYTRIYPDGTLKDVTWCKIYCCNCCCPDNSKPYCRPPQNVAVVQIEPVTMPYEHINGGYNPQGNKVYPIDPGFCAPAGIQTEDSPPAYNEINELENTKKKKNGKKRKNRKR